MPHLLFLLCLAVSVLHGCAWGIYEDQRLMDTMANDKSLAASIKTALAKEKFTDALSIGVYSYYGNVFLVGEIPQSMQNKALAIAQGKKPRTVTPHWFSKEKAETGDMVLSTKLRSALIGTKGLSSTRVDTEVNAGRVVLLGVVASNEERQLAIKTARAVSGVNSVTSYLMLPQRVGAVEEVGGTTMAGERPAREKASSGIEERELPPPGGRK